MTNTQQKSQKKSTGLWIPFSIILVGIFVSLIFAFQTLRGYRKPRPLLIKPSSINSAGELTTSLHKALYPLKLQGYGFELDSDGSTFGDDLKNSLESKFGKSEKNISARIQKIDLSQSYDNSKIDCLNTALFNMLRKPERKWKKNIYFSVCTEADKKFSIYYSTDKNQIK